ncbi:histidinol-phosphate transaminase [Sulfolobales archaeon HS-7]|nr:histidinol-phosphate transaminase [Sulfolobales archaeon HS-7]
MINEELDNRLKYLRGLQTYDFTDYNDIIRLHLNESPFSPSERVIKRIVEVAREGNRYPNPERVEMFKVLAGRYCGVKSENVIPTPGGDGAIRLIVNNLLRRGEKAVVNFPSYSMYSVYSSVKELRLTKVNLIEENYTWRADTDALVNSVRDAKVTFIDDPNNPTGAKIFGGKEEEIREILETTNGLVVVDEAYHEFAGYSVTRLVDKYDNLIVIRTFSKAFGMAGFRVGYLVTNENITNALRKATTPFDVSAPSLEGAIEALLDPSYALENATIISKIRSNFTEKLRRAGFKVYDSVTNFILIKDARDLKSLLFSHGIAIRRVNDGLYRISIGTNEQIEKVEDVLLNSI